MDEVKSIINGIKKGETKPLYFLMGDEPFFIDQIASHIEKNVLQEHEKEFNQMVLYGRDVTIDDIVGNAKRFPMMAEKQVIIVKEAQDLSRSIEQLVDYTDAPQNSTVLVLCYKYKKLDKRKKLHKSIAKNGVIYESKRLYENQVFTWIKSSLQAKDYKISPKAIQILVEFLGTDLGKIDNELQKLYMLCPTGTEITPAIIEQNIGISKDFNNFELNDAIALRDEVKAHRIVNYFSQNPKENPMVVTVSTIFGFLSKVQQYHALGDKSKANVAKTLKIHPFFVKDYSTAAGNYPMKKISLALSYLRDADVKSKGVGVAGVSSGDLLKELLVKIMR